MLKSLSTEYVFLLILFSDIKGSESVHIKSLKNLPAALGLCPLKINIKPAVMGLRGYFYTQCNFSIVT